MSNSTSIWPTVPQLIAKTTSLDQAPFPVFWLDQYAHIGYVNKELCKVTGHSDKTLINQTSDLLLPNINASSWNNDWWPILIKDKEIPGLSTTFLLQNGQSIERTISASLVNISGLNFAALYLLPKVNSETIINNNSATHFLGNLNESIAILDKTAKVHYANPAMCEKINVLSTDLIGRSLLEFITPSQSQLQNIWQALQLEQPSETEFECKNYAGNELVLRMNVVPQQSDKEELDQLLVSFVDITEQHRIAQELEQRNASYERLASNIPGFIYKFKMTSNGEFSFPYASIGCQEIFGVAPADVANDATPIIETIHLDDLQMFQETVVESASQLTPWNLEARLTTIENEWKWFHAASRPELQTNGDIIWEGLVMDVTDRKQAEGELARAKENAEALADTKAAFLSNMSHEIRTPLNAVIGLTRLVLETKLSSIQHDYINKVLSSSEVLLGIVNNVLDFSKIESGKLNLEKIEFSLTSIFENIGNIVEAQAAEKGLELLVENYSEDLEFLVGDPLRLEQVLINFCNNAIKFTEQGEVLISVRAIKEQNKSVIIKFSVKDTGIGLTENQQQKIFESFTQADNSTTRRYGGTGLGLTICKQIAELMGGEIGVESMVDQGSLFFFTAVMEKADHCSDQRMEFSAEINKKQILYIDDNVKACKLNSQMLESTGLQVKSVLSEQLAIDKLVETIDNTTLNQYDLILLDSDIDGKDGIETIHRIKQIPEYAETPIIMMISTVYSIGRFKTVIDNKLITNVINKPLIKSKIVAEIEYILFNKIAKQTKNRLESVPLNNFESILSGRRILLAEDNAINQEIAQKILESKGIEVLVVNNGQEAVELLTANTDSTVIDAVLMDLQMPIMDGFEATRLIRQDNKFETLPIIAMTAHVFSSEKDNCLTAGMQAHVSKPILPDQLFSTLVEAIQFGDKKTTEDIMVIDQPISILTEENSPDIIKLAELTTVDVISAKKLLNEDELLLNKLLFQFADEQAVTVAQLKQRISDQQHQEASELAHLIQGVAGNLHIRDVFDSAVDLENALNKKSTQNIDNLVNVFEDHFNQFTNELDHLGKSQVLKITEEYPQNDENNFELDHVMEKLDKLIIHLDNNNFKAGYYLEELDPFLSSFYRQELDQFSDLIMDLNFSAAAEIAKDLKTKLSKSCAE